MRHTILIIDDEADQGELLCDIAEGLGHSATATVHSLDATELYRSLQPSLVILDMVMPEADGFEVIKALGAVGCAAPVLLISGYNPHYLQSAQTIAGHYGIRHLTTMRKPLHVDAVRRYMKETLAA